MAKAAKSRNARHRDLEQAVKLNGHGVLRSIIETARHDHGFSLGDLTVLSIQVDPLPDRHHIRPSRRRMGRASSQSSRRAHQKNPLEGPALRDRGQGQHPQAQRRDLPQR
jgi:ribosomal protein L22